MTTVQRYNKLLQLSTVGEKEIETEIESGDFDELRDLNENINGIIKKLQPWTDTIQEEMLDDDKSLDEIKQWIANQKQELDQFRGIKDKIKGKIYKNTKKRNNYNLSFKNRNLFKTRSKCDVWKNKRRLKKPQRDEYNEKRNG